MSNVLDSILYTDTAREIFEIDDKREYIIFANDKIITLKSRVMAESLANIYNTKVLFRNLA